MKNLQDHMSKVIQESSIRHIDESKLSDMFKSAGDKITGFISKLKTFIITTWNDMTVKATSPINTFIAYAKGLLPKDSVAMSLPKKAGNYKQYGATKGDPEDIVKMSSYVSTIDMWKGKGVNEEMLQYQSDNYINESGALDLNHPNAEQFGKNNVDEKGLSMQLKAALAMPERLKLLIWGAPGIGKTAIVRSFLKSVSTKMKVIAIELPRMNPDDFTLPYFEKDKDGKIIAAADMPKSWIPCYKMTGNAELDKIANNVANGALSPDEVGEGGVLFFDEISRCSPKVQSAALTLIQDREIAGYKIGSKWAIIAAANRRTDDLVADIEVSKTLTNRFTQQVNFVPQKNSWMNWAEKHAYMNADVLRFIKFNEEYWYKMHPDDDEELIFPSPRSWEGACLTLCAMAGAGEEEGFKLSDLDDDIIEMVISGAVGAGVARQFMNYYRLTREVDVDKLYKVWDNPKSAPKFRKEMDLNYYMTSKLLSACTEQPTPEQYNNFISWLLSSDNASLVSNAYGVLWIMYPEIQLLSGDPRMQASRPDDWDKYGEGVRMIIDKFPELNKDIEKL